jgi:hypothetical protein
MVFQRGSGAGRLLNFWYHQRIKGLTPPADPEFDQETSETFEQLLSAAKSYMEFGAGGSTVAADRAGIATLSIESDPFYAKVVRGSLSEQSSVEIVHANIGLTGRWGWPVFLRKTKNRLQKWSSYPRMASRGFSRPSGPPDLVLIDGRFRRACALHVARQALLHQHQVHLLFDDYYSSGRQHYHSVEQHLPRPQRVGRAALFLISEDTMLRAPEEVAILTAEADPR